MIFYASEKFGILNFLNFACTQNIGLHQLYRTMDLLAEIKYEIEKVLFWCDRGLLNGKVDVILYDLT